MPKSPPEKLAQALRANLKRRKPDSASAPSAVPERQAPRTPPRPPKKPG